MYLSFFNLIRPPFEVSPDPLFLFPTSHHREALAGLSFGIKARKGFVILTGEVGTGKTLVIRCLLDWLDQNNIEFAYVTNSRLSSFDFLKIVAADFGVNHRQNSKGDLLLELNQHLIHRFRQGLTTVMIVDEAQLLNVGVLEEVRLLTNLETPQGKLLQIVLAGQPELESLMQSPGMRQLKQRIALWLRLRPLSEIETQGYVLSRLKQAGDESGNTFSLPGLQRIFLYSRGIPRLINTLSENAMISAYSLGRHRVTATLIDEAAADLRLGRPQQESGGSLAREREVSGPEASYTSEVQR